jgi:hypothetical protein
VSLWTGSARLALRRNVAVNLLGYALIVDRLMIAFLCLDVPGDRR